MNWLPKNFGKEVRKQYSLVSKEASELIYLYQPPEEEDCPNCISGPDGGSTGIFDSSFVTPLEIFDIVYNPISFSRGRCPVCRGAGKLSRLNSRVGVKAVVHWNPSYKDGDLKVEPAGVEGNNIVLIKVDRCYYENLRDCEYAVIDGVECSLMSPPFIRTIGGIDVKVIAYLQSREVGHSVKD